MKPTRPIKITDYIVIAGSLLITSTFVLWAILQSWSPKRTINDIENMTLLWSGDIDINYPVIYSYNGNAIVYTSAGLSSFDLSNGRKNWQTDILSPSVIRIHDEKIVVSSGKWLEAAPTANGQEFPSCFFGGAASLSTYDPNTGEIVWGYGYRGVDPSTLGLNGQHAFLTGFANQSTSRAISEIDLTSGAVTYHDCSWDVRERPIQNSSADESWPEKSSSYQIVVDDAVFPISQDSKFFVQDTKTMIVIGQASFRGVGLNPYQMVNTFVEDKLVIYFEDSHQIYVFQLQAN